MGAIVSAFFVISLIFALGMVYFFLTSLKTIIYPSKTFLLKKAAVLGAGGTTFFLIGFLLKKFIAH